MSEDNELRYADRRLRVICDCCYSVVEFRTADVKTQLVISHGKHIGSFKCVDCPRCGYPVNPGGPYV